MSEIYTCLDCGWEGLESELITNGDPSVMPINTNCPVCCGENVD